jgi:hypothetical protein
MGFTDGRRGGRALAHVLNQLGREPSVIEVIFFEVDVEGEVSCRGSDNSAPVADGS